MKDRWCASLMTVTQVRSSSVDMLWCYTIIALSLSFSLARVGR